MPNETPRIKLPYPAEHEDPWYENFEGFVQGADEALYAAREDRHLIFAGGGTFTWNSTSGALTWGSTITILSAIKGLLWEIPANSVVLSEGQLLYVNLVRSPVANTELSPQVASQVPSTNEALILGVRIGSKVYFRNGRVISNLEAVELFDTGGTGGGGGSSIGVSGQRIRNNVSLSTNDGTDQATFVSIGAFTIDPDQHQLDGTSLDIRFKVVGQVTKVGLTGVVELYNLTDAAVVSTLTLTGTTPSEQLSGALPLASGTKLYEVRCRVVGGTPPSDRVLVLWAGFQLDNVID